jgi:hypothetical protein
MLDLVRLFLLLAGFVVGLGAVTVIDIHGFLGRKSSYFPEKILSLVSLIKRLWKKFETFSRVIFLE